MEIDHLIVLVYIVIIHKTGFYYPEVLFSPMVSGWAGGLQEKVCPGCISETIRCRKLIRGRDIG